MRRRITPEEALALLRSRDQLLSDGVTERSLRGAVSAGALIRVHRGYYVSAHDWESLWVEGRVLLRTVAVHLAHRQSPPVFVLTSAAVLWDLPLYGALPDGVNLLLRSASHSQAFPGVARRAMSISDDDITVRHGMLCTSLARTVLDLSRAFSAEVAVSAADAALARVAVTGHRQDEDAAAQWRDEMLQLARPGLRGVRQARWIAEFADGRAQLPGESVSRLQLHRLGFRDVQLQVPVTGAAGANYFLDFGFPRSRCFGEFDGEGKYFDPASRASATTAEAIFEEKHREDDVRGVTGWRLARWATPHIRTPRAFGTHLAAFNLHPPG